MYLNIFINKSHNDKLPTTFCADRFINIKQQFQMLIGHKLLMRYIQKIINNKPHIKVSMDL